MMSETINDEERIVEKKAGQEEDDGIISKGEVKIEDGINSSSLKEIFEGEQIAEFRFPRAAIAVSSDAENRAVTFLDGTFLQLTVWFARFDDNVTASFDRWTDDSRP